MKPELIPLRHLNPMKYLLSSCIVIAALSALRAEDVPQFRGVGGLGLSKETGLPVEWDAKKNIRWKADLPGRGLSNPVIADGRVYVSACNAYEQKREVVLCYDLKTGAKLWERQVWATGSTLAHPKSSMAAPTPLTDGSHVYALFATGDLVCYDRDGKLGWYRSLVADYPTVGNNVGAAASPVLWKDLVILTMENVGESFAVGIDKKTGQNRWRIDRPRGINWVTPILFNNNGKDEVLFQGPDGITACDPATGKTTWTYAAKLGTIPSASTGDGVVFTQGDKFIALAPGDGKKDAKPLWQSNKLRTGYGSPVIHKNRLYTVAFGGIVNCTNAQTGEILWTHRLEGNYSASPLLAEDRLYIVCEDGTTTVMQAADEAKVLATSKLNDMFMACPVASNGAIFLRSDKALYCIGK
jgi:outer membrane protein assembly factor BamB